MEFGELFEGCPIKKWQEVILHANPSIVGRELERILEELAKAELQKEGLPIDAASLEYQKKNIAIHSMGNILSQNE